MTSTTSLSSSASNAPLGGTAAVRTKSTRKFQYYLDNLFKFPKDIKNDIIYCQRALKAHIQVHQMVLDVNSKQGHVNTYQIRDILNDIETAIYEINAEQHFLFLRLRRLIDQFYKMLKEENIAMDLPMVNSFVAKEVVPLVNDESKPIHPINVTVRKSKQKLMEKYFEEQKKGAETAAIPAIQEEKHVYEIIDSDEEEGIGKLVIAGKLPATVNPAVSQQRVVVAEVDLTNDDVAPPATSAASKNLQNGTSNSGHSGAVLGVPQVSLLKPISQRMSGGLPLHEEVDTIQAPKVETDPLVVPAVGKEAPSIELPVSKNVKMSRMNLRQALKRARTAAVSAAAPPQAPQPPQAPLVKRKTPSPPVVPAPVVKKPNVKTRATRGSVAAAMAAAAAAKTTEIHSSSEDSNIEREPTPPHAMWPYEPEETRTLPEHYGQEMFLRLFKLFTPEMHVQMQQRRSKRKRRTVHSNERADFHYGRIEYGSYPPPEESKKKRKAFLLSPQVKRGLQSKRSKRSSAEKNDDASPPSRSTSSSPDDKRACNECLKGGGFLEQCQDCKGYYHQSCHRETEDEKPNSTKRTAAPQNKLKLCPACKRLQDQLHKKEAEQYKTLHNEAKELELKMFKEKHRRSFLQLEGRNYKIRMRNLFNILNAMKSDQENDSSE